MRDAIGREIKVSDHVAYAMRKGNRAVLHTGTVIATRRNGSAVVVDVIAQGKASVWEDPERIVVLGACSGPRPQEQP
jgi:hypothetical protein